MAVLTIPSPDETAPRAIQRTPLDGVDFILIFDWNIRANQWSLDIRTGDGVDIITGIAIISLWDVLRSLSALNRPLGRIVWTGSAPPGLEDLVEGLTYFDASEG